MNKLILPVLFLSAALLAEPVPNKRLAPPHKDQKGPQLGAVFRNNTYFPVYEKGETAVLNCYVKNGELKENDVLVWKLFDWQKKLLKSGRIEVTPEQMKQALDLQFNEEKAGCYFVELKLEKSGITVPWEGSRPKGYVTFGVQPGIARLPLKDPKESRFGMNGITNIEEDLYSPVGTMLGIHWADHMLRPWRLEKKRGDYREVSKEKIEEIWKIPYHKSPIRVMLSAEKNKVVLLHHLQGLPHHLVKVPKEYEGKPVKSLESAYIYNDPVYYREFLGKLVRSTRNYRETKLKYETTSHYLIHWEPDWHWRGSTDEFLQMYKDSWQVIRENDPKGILLGANIGVLDRAVPRMRELFEKGLASYIQGVAVHLYFLPIFSLPEDKNLHGDCREMRRLTDQYLGKNAPLMNTEWGTCAVKTMQVDHPLLLNHMYRFIRGHLIALGEGFSTTFLFYSTDYNFINYPDSGEHGYGMTFNLSRTNFGGLNSQPKPTYMAAVAMTQLIEGTQSLGRLDYLDPEVFAYTFRRADKNLVALWAPHRKQTVTLNTGVESVTVYDIMGNSSTVKTPDGKITLTANEYPQYILGISDTVLPTAPRNASSLFREAKADLMTGSSLDVLLNKKTAGKFTYRLVLANQDTVTIKDGRLPKTISAGARKLEAYDEKGNFVESMMLNVISPLRITEFADIPGKNGALSLGVTVANRSKEPQKATLLLLYRKDSVAERNIELKGNETKQVRFDVSNLYQGLGLADLSVMAYSDYGILAEKTKHNWGVSSASALSPVIDGNLNEWNRKKFSPVHGRRAMIRNNKWTGNEDFSVCYQTAADEKGIYIALEVTDDSDYYKTDLKKPWLADCVMFAIGKNTNHSGAWENVQFFSVGRDENGKAAVHSMIGLPPNQELIPLGKETVNAEVKRDEKRKVTVYEIHVPWKTIGGKVPYFGLGIAIEDADSEADVVQDRHSEITLMGGIPFFMSSALMSTVHVK